MGVVLPQGFGQWTLPIRLIGDLEEMVVTMGFFDQNPGTTTPDQIANSITNDLFARSSFAATSVSNQYTLGPGRVTVNRSLGTFDGVGTVTRVGTGTLTPLPQNCAVLVRKNTTRGGRRGRGRLYLPPFMVAESNVTPAGVILQSVVDQLTLDFNTWRDNLVALQLTPALLHSEPEIGPAVPPDVITSFTCQAVIATQRERLRR